MIFLCVDCTEIQTHAKTKNVFLAKSKNDLKVYLLNHENEL